MITGRGPGIGGSILLSSPSASEAALVPLTAYSSSRFSFETGYQRRFELRALDQAFVAMAASAGNWNSAVALSQFGYADLYRELTARVAVGRRFGCLSGMVSWTGMLVDFGGGYDRLSSGTLNLGIGCHYGKLRAAMVANNLTSPGLYAGSPEFKPDYTLFAELSVMGRHSLLGNVVLQQDRKPRFGLGQIINLTDYAGLVWGISTSPTQYGGGIQLRVGRQAVNYTARYHPTLGYTHTVSLTLNIARDSSTE
jgi:hypothetical protein